GNSIFPSAFLDSRPARRAASRSVIAPPPVIALSSSQRFAVSTFHSRSAEANEICAPRRKGSVFSSQYLLNSRPTLLSTASSVAESAEHHRAQPAVAGVVLHALVPALREADD